MFKLEADGSYHLVASYNVGPRTTCELLRGARSPIVPGRGTHRPSRTAHRVAGRCTCLTCSRTTSTLARGQAKGWLRTELGVPMLRQASRIGVIVVARADRPARSPTRQIELVTHLRRSGRDRDRERAPVR